MREAGWYWIKIIGWPEWVIGYFNGISWLSSGVGSIDEIVNIGPKIEEPEE